MSKAALTEKQIRKRNYDREAKRTERAEKKAAGLVLYAGHWVEVFQRELLRIEVERLVKELRK